MESQPQTAPQGDLTLTDFDFAFPEELVAHTPLGNRDQSRLLVRSADGQIDHLSVSDIVDKLDPDTVLIFNNSRVFPSRLEGHLPTGGKFELFLIREDESGVWSALGRPMRKLAPGKIVGFGHGLEAHVLDRTGDFLSIKFNVSSQDLTSWLDRFGFIPLPPYIKREAKIPAASSPDRDRYQTVYAQERGSVAAPTAGLHFSEALLSQLRARGIKLHDVSLHVGAGTFLPVKHNEVSKHQMHQELYRVPSSTLEAIKHAKNLGHKVVAVGTTTLRSLEDLYRRAGHDPEKLSQYAETWHSTGIFLYPRTSDDVYRPWIIDGLVTNFHQPKSTLFMLISKLIGLPQAKSLYEEAFRERYRLFSYGDASLLWL